MMEDVEDVENRGFGIPRSVLREGIALEMTWE